MFLGGVAARIRTECGVKGGGNRGGGGRGSNLRLSGPSELRVFKHPDTTRLCPQGSGSLSSCGLIQHLSVFAGSPRKPLPELEASESRHVIFPTLLDLSPVFKLTLLRKPAIASQPFSSAALCRPRTKQDRQAKEEATVPPERSGLSNPGITYRRTHPSSWRARQFKPLFPVIISILFFRIETDTQVTQLVN